MLARLWPRWRRYLVIVQPETVVCWHRTAWRRYWTWRSGGRPRGRPRIYGELASLIRQMSEENPRWGHMRVLGELRKLGFRVSLQTVRRYTHAACNQCQEGKGAILPGRKDTSSVAASASTNWAAYAAGAWMVLFAAVHLYWGVGGRMGLPAGVSIHESTPLLVINWLAVPLSLVGALLALALTRGWGDPVRRPLLIAAWSTSALLVVHALPTVIEGLRIVVGLRTVALSPEERYSFFLYEPYWLLGGVLFGLAAWSFQRRIAPRNPAADGRRGRGRHSRGP